MRGSVIRGVCCLCLLFLFPRPVSSQLQSPTGLFLDPKADRLYVANTGGNSILIFEKASLITGEVSPSRIIEGSATTFNQPSGLYFDSGADRLYVSNPGNRALLVFDRASHLNGNVAPNRSITGRGTGLTFPVGLYLDPVRDTLYVADSHPGSVLVFSKASEISGATAPERAIIGDKTSLNGPFSLLLDPSRERLFISNFGSLLIFHQISTINGDIPPAHTISGPATGLRLPRGIFLDTGKGLLYVADVGSRAILVFRLSDLSGTEVSPARKIAGPASRLRVPFGLFLDTVRDILYLVDSGTHSILAFHNVSQLEGDVPPDRTITPKASSRLPRLPLPTSVIP